MDKDEQNSEEKNNIDLNIAPAKDNKFLSDSGIVIVEDKPQESEVKKDPITTNNNPVTAGKTLAETKPEQAVPQSIKTEEKIDSTPKEEIPAEKKPLETQTDDNLEEKFKNELSYFEKDISNKDINGDHIKELSSKLDSLHKKIESVRSIKKEALEEELAEFKKLKEEIEGGLNKLKELESLSKKIDEEKDKIHQVDVMEKEIEEDVQKIEEEINDTK